MVQATVRRGTLQELELQVDALRASGNVVSFKEVRSFAGRANHVANLVTPWRPFLQQVWAALSSQDDSPPGCIFRSRIDTALLLVGRLPGGASRDAPEVVYTGGLLGLWLPADA